MPGRLWEVGRWAGGWRQKFIQEQDVKADEASGSEVTCSVQVEGQEAGGGVGATRRAGGLPGGQHLGT